MPRSIEWADVAISDLPAELRELCETVAGAATPIEAAERLVESWGGDKLYVPTLRDLRRRALERRVRTLFDASADGGRGNAGEVCRKLGVSRRQLKTLLAPPAAQA